MGREPQAAATVDASRPAAAAHGVAAAASSSLQRGRQAEVVDMSVRHCSLAVAPQRAPHVTHTLAPTGRDSTQPLRAAEQAVDVRSVHNAAAFFLGLQGQSTGVEGVVGGESSHGGHGTLGKEPARPPLTGPGWPDSPAALRGPPEPCQMKINVALPESHTTILQVLMTEYSSLRDCTPGLDPKVEAADFLSVPELEEAMQATAKRAAASTHALGSLMKAYAAMAVLKQTALSLMEYGIVCAKLVSSITTCAHASAAKSPFSKPLPCVTVLLT
jgi:hypothetical protein